MKHLLQTKHVDLKSNETTDNQPINNMNVILHELDKTNRSGNNLSKTLINFYESICDDKLNSPASQKMLDHNDIDNSDKRNIKNDINRGNDDINAKNNKLIVILHHTTLYYVILSITNIFLPPIHFLPLFFITTVILPIVTKRS